MYRVLIGDRITIETFERLLTTDEISEEESTIDIEVYFATSKDVIKFLNEYCYSNPHFIDKKNILVSKVYDLGSL